MVRGTGLSFSSGMYSPPSALSSALSDSDSELDSIATSGSGTVGLDHEGLVVWQTEY